MIITRQWIQEYLDISSLSTDDICKALDSIGLEVDSVKKVSIPKKIVIGKVQSCEKHPDADKLNICQVDVGKEVVQIVCGASNVAKGQIIPAALVGADLGNDFIIKAAKLRGVASNGMICSSTEIGLAKLNDGILVLDDSIGELKLGNELCNYPLLNDEIIEIELTANRGDCLSINGITRELSTYFNISLNILETAVTTNHKGIGQFFDVNYDTNCEANLVYKAADITNFKLNLLENLRASTIDQLKKSDIETAIAYTTHCTGVVLNVYSKSIASKQSNKLLSLDIKQNKNGFDTVSGKVLLSTIGIESGEITDNDNEVIIEASYTNPEVLSQKVFDKKEKTGDIYYRTSRGSEPNLSFGIDKLTSFISEHGATIYNGRKDFISEIQENIITVHLNKINAIIGQDIDKNEIIKILMSLGFEVKTNGHDALTITIPNFRHDIKNIADITEEIVRIIGIDKIKSKPLQIEEYNRINTTSNRLLLQNDIRAKSIANGFFETITYVFTNKDLLDKYKLPKVSTKLDILNPIVNELNTFRTNIALNLAQAVSHNTKQGYKSLGLFEIGIKFNEKREETKTLAFIQSGNKENESVENGGKPQKVDFFAFAQKVSSIVGDFELETIEKTKNSFVHPYQNANILKDGIKIGELYKLHPNVSKDFDIDNETFVCEIEFNKLQSITIFASNISKFQSSKRDLSIIAPKDLEYKEIKKVINSLNISEIKQYNLVDIYSDDKLGSNESLTIKFVLQSEIKTMEESEINNIIEQILEKLQKELNIGIR
ncbi:MAG: phenylalanine--tRNA ligase subunit beta [Campylobacterota bacterium]|nr:phenylalanine--tRNA ligase subunit beta [Campylobacterota bacterium]